MTIENLHAIHMEISRAVPPGTWQGDRDEVWRDAAVKMIYDLHQRVEDLESEAMMMRKYVRTICPHDFVLRGPDDYHLFCPKCGTIKGARRSEGAAP